MATLSVLPSQEIISGFKGTIDFYVYMGTPCARSWPRSPGRRRAPAVEAQWPAFAWASSYWQHLSKEVQDAYLKTAQDFTMSGRDLFVKSVISSYFREGQWESLIP